MKAKQQITIRQEYFSCKSALTLSDSFGNYLTSAPNSVFDVGRKFEVRLIKM